MQQKQWDAFKKAAKRQPVDSVPLALIVDSPWMPGYLGINHLDYFLNPEVWFQSNLRVAQDFPDVTLFPSWWVEYGMAIEPSAMGARITFQPDQPPGQSATLHRLGDLDHMVPIDPRRDGFMSLALHRYRMQKQRIFDAGYTIHCMSVGLGADQELMSVQKEFERLREKYAPLVDDDIAHVERELNSRRRRRARTR